MTDDTNQTAIEVATRHHEAMQAIGLSAELLTNNAAALHQLVDAERTMHSSMHITDPTLYRDAVQSIGLRQQVQLARAALAFVLVVQQIKAELTPRQGRAPRNAAVFEVEHGDPKIQTRSPSRTRQALEKIAEDKRRAVGRKEGLEE